MKREELLTFGVIESNFQPDLFELEHPRAYVGFESSGSLHIGHLGIFIKLRDLQRAGFTVMVFLSSFHAELNNKPRAYLNIEKITQEIRSCRFLDQSNLTIIESDQIVDKQYLLRGLVALGEIPLNRLKKSLEITNRGEDAYIQNPKILLYPIYQMLDIDVLDIDLSLGGIDQRSVHILFNEEYTTFRDRKVSYLHLPILESITTKTKMSKSLGNVITFDFSLEQLEAIFNKAFFDYRLHTSGFLEGILHLINMYHYRDLSFTELCSREGPENVRRILAIELHSIFRNFS